MADATGAEPMVKGAATLWMKLTCTDLPEYALAYLPLFGTVLFPPSRHRMTFRVNMRRYWE